MSSPASVDFWRQLRNWTQARIGLGRVGDALPTDALLDFRVSHAAARDAVHQPLDVPALRAAVDSLGLGEAVLVSSQARDRSEYLRRPDLGRLPRDVSALPSTPADIGFVLADGLSPRALEEHAVPLLSAILVELDGRYRIAPPVIATQARVAIGDHIGAAIRMQTVLVLIGERPGLSVADSLGIYLTHLPRPGRTDAERNCISNIHPPSGLGYDAAAGVVGRLIAGARQLGRSGVDLKDTSRAAGLGAPAAIDVEELAAVQHPPE